MRHDATAAEESRAVSCGQRRLAAALWILAAGCSPATSQTPASDAMDTAAHPGLDVVVDAEVVEITEVTDDAEEAVDAEDTFVLPDMPLPDHLGGGFIDLTADLEAWPPFDVHPGSVQAGRVPDVTYGVFVDIDGDGRDEVVLSGLSEAEGTPRQVYGYDPDTQRLVAEPDTTIASGGLVLAEDLDRDGHTDLLVVRIGDIAIQWGNAFGTVGQQTILGQDGELGDVERTAFHLHDLDADGWLDLMMRDACGMMALMRTRPRVFEQRPELLAGYETTTPYAIGTWQTPGRAPVVISMGHGECGFYTGFAVNDLDAEGYPLLDPVELYEGHPYPHPGGWTGLVSASPMGGAVSDLNRDGAMDLFITLNPDQVIFDGLADWPIMAPMMHTGLRVIPSDNGLAQIGWGVALLDLDRDGLDDAIVAHGNDQSRWEGTDPDPGPQWVTVHWNAGDFRFVDATEHLGMGLRGGWRALGVGDIDGDADPDLVTGGLGEAPRVYRNDVETPLKGFALRLVGTTSNALGLGAEVIVTPEGADSGQHYTVGGMFSPKTVSSPVLYPGIGQADAAEVTVTWPSGVVQTAEGLEAGQVHVLTEPEVLSVEPWGRHVKIAEDTVATLTVRPQSPATSVTAHITHGDGIPGLATETGDGGWTLEIAPPPTPGFARVEVRIDGQPIEIRPRIWWD